MNKYKVKIHFDGLGDVTITTPGGTALDAVDCALNMTLQNGEFRKRLDLYARFRETHNYEVVAVKKI